MNSDRLRRVRRQLKEKSRRIEALLILFPTNPTWPIEAMVREYGAALDITEGTNHGSDVMAATGGLNPHQKAAQTKRQRTHEKLIAAATKLVIQRESFRLRDVAERAGVGVATVHTHFRTKDELIRAVYDRLIETVLDQV